MRHLANGGCDGRDGVSIHASVKDATVPEILVSALDSCFNPRICKRCDHDQDFDDVLPTVSIHASVKDATPCL